MTIGELEQNVIDSLCQRTQQVLTPEQKAVAEREAKLQSRRDESAARIAEILAVVSTVSDLVVSNGNNLVKRSHVQNSDGSRFHSIVYRSDRLAVMEASTIPIFAVAERVTHEPYNPSSHKSSPGGEVLEAVSMGVYAQIEEEVIPLTDPRIGLASIHRIAELGQAHVNPGQYLGFLEDVAWHNPMSADIRLGNIVQLLADRPAGTPNQDW